MCFQIEKMVPQITRINDLNLIIFLSSCPNKKELDIGVNSLNMFAKQFVSCFGALS